jgi:tetratricopeptide (TPR) repeat protein
MVGRILWMAFLFAALLENGEVRATQSARSDPDAYPRLTDWPLETGALGYFQIRWQIAQTAAERLRTAPLSPSTITWLGRAGRPADALATLQRIVEQQPELMAEAVERFQKDVRPDQTQDLKSRMRDALRLARARLPSLVREEQAALAVALLSFELSIEGRRDYHPRLRELVSTYAGTRAADLAKVDLASERLSMATLTTLDDLAAAHPGTEVAAKALYTKAAHLARNASALRLAPPGSDPTDRLLDVLRLVSNLESGAYPRCRWVDEAPQVVVDFSLYRAVFSPENAERALAGLMAFARAHFRLSEEPADQNRIFYLLSNRLPEVAMQTKDGAAGVDRLWPALEADAPDPAMVRLAKAQGLLRPYDGRPTPAARIAGMQALAEAAELGASTFARKALASLAESDFTDGRHAEARVRFSTFLQKYPFSDFAWMAALRIGQAEQALGRHTQAAAAFVEAAQRFTAVPLARVLGAAYAAQSLETAGAQADALTRYRESLAAWTPDLGDRLQGGAGPSPGRAARLEEDPGTITRDEVASRVDQLSQFLTLPGGPELERGRWLHLTGNDAEAIPVLDAVARQFAGASTGAEAASILRRARLETALARADVTAAKADPVAALSALDALAREPFDVHVGIAGVAAATLRLLRGSQADAEAGMHTALRRWIAEGATKGPRPAPGTLEADVLAIRDLVFRPLGGGPLDSHWNAHQWPSTLPAYLLALSDLRVTTPGTPHPLRVNVAWQPPRLWNVVFLSSEQLADFVRVIPRLGGVGQRQPTAVMETPNQPIGGARAIVQWWNRFFPARPGHWMGFELLTYPTFSTIEFTNAERTRALVPVTIGYSGGTIVLEKVDGIWTMKELVNQWIT